jgi:hypothetical protein
MDDQTFKIRRPLPQELLDATWPPSCGSRRGGRPIQRLLVEPDPRKPGSFTARLDGEVIVVSNQPLVDGARELLRRGHDPAELLTLRHQNSPFDSFRAERLGCWARSTYHESANRPLRQERWTPFAGATGRQKSGFATGREESCPPVVDRLTAVNWP